MGNSPILAPILGRRRHLHAQVTCLPRGQPRPDRTKGPAASVQCPCQGTPSGSCNRRAPGGISGTHLTTVLSKADLASLWNVITTLVAGRSTRHCFR